MSVKEDAKQCPWCERWCLKDGGCNYIFACGLDSQKGFIIGGGCGKTWCWGCGLKYCGIYYDPLTGQKTGGAKDSHDGLCCKAESGFILEKYCAGGCSPHCEKRW